MAHSTVEQIIPNNLTHTKNVKEHFTTGNSVIISFPLADISLGNGAEEKDSCVFFSLQFNYCFVNLKSIRNLGEMLKNSSSYKIQIHTLWGKKNPTPANTQSVGFQVA